jgi:hypothetical protein
MVIAMITSLSLAAVLLLSWSRAWSDTPVRPVVAISDGRVSVSGKGATVRQVLLEIADRSGVQIELEAGLHDQVAVDTTAIAFDGATIEEALRRLFRNQNFAFVYARDALTEARIYGDGTGEFRRLTAPKPRDDAHPPARRRDPDRPRTPDPPNVFGPPGPADRFTEIARTGREADVIRAALEALKRERDPEVLEAALDALEGLDEVPLDPLFDFARTSQDPDLTVQAMQLLADLGEGNKRVMSFLSKLAQDSPSAQVRNEATSLLAELSRPPAPQPKEVVPPHGWKPPRPAH